MSSCCCSCSSPASIAAPAAAAASDIATTPPYPPPPPPLSCSSSPMLVSCVRYAGCDSEPSIAEALAVLVCVWYLPLSSLTDAAAAVVGCGSVVDSLEN